MKIITREQAIQMLIEDDEDTIGYEMQHGTNNYLRGILEEGHTGYTDWSNGSLAEEIEKRYNNGQYKIER